MTSVLHGANRRIRLSEGTPAKNRTIIRRATRDDLTTIVRIERASFGCDAWERKWFADYLAAPENCVFLVAATSEIVVGYALAVHNQTRSELDSIGWPLLIEAAVRRPRS